MKKTVLFITLVACLSFYVYAAEDCICTMQYDPVCGVDGKTYGNACTLGCAGVELDYTGECALEVDSTPPEEIMIDDTCIRWFDGCNTCSVVDGKPEVCTEMACFTLQRAKCLDNTFVLLKENHEITIRIILQRYLNSFEDVVVREDAKQKLITTLATKKQDIKTILMVSKFASDSPVLRKYMLTLEVIAVLDSLL